ncbi:PKD domain-containing protein [Sinomicrobium oceani]|uniref:PKD domain-containing protein n=1 Tax=Sinomicrobium oceani TaxID=1150368 RepID=A0A1K1MU51_9FLAO|nr:carbohydrate-binding protein [Sinomicrobium oceani]SFW26696.1 PKD domain-containing protein [Sinomicrobium oceani]
MKKYIPLKGSYLFLLCLVLSLSCEDDIQEVALFDKGETVAEASASEIDFGNTVRFTSTSTKALTTDWTFQGGSPSTSINSDVTVTYTAPGTFEAQLIVKYVDNTIDTRTFSITVKGIPEPLPYGGTPLDLEGIIEAENFDLGGEGIAYHDTEEENLAVTNGSSVYRDDRGVDVEVGENVTNIGYTNEGEWVNYTVNVLETGDYDFEFMLASGHDEGGHSVKLQRVDPNTGAISDLGETGDFENTGGWSVYTGISVPGITLSQGLHTLRFYFTGGGTNLDKVNVTLRGATPPIDGLGIYTEREISETNAAIIPPINNANFVISEVEDAAHGNRALYYKFDPANSSSPQTWGAMATLFPRANVNASSYTHYHISLKTSSTSNIRIRIKAGGTNYWVTLHHGTTDETYGMARDGKWHEVKIPLADFNAPDLSSISEILVLRSDDADFGNTSPDDTARDFDWYVDDIYLTKE